MEHHRQVKSTTDQNVKKTTTGREEGQEGGGDSGGGGGEGGEGGRGCCWLRTCLFENSPRIFYFTPGNFRQNKPLALQTPQNCVTPFGNIKRPRITGPLEISRFFPDHCCNKNSTLILVNPWTFYLLFLQYPWKLLS